MQGLEGAELQHAGLIPADIAAMQTTRALSSVYSQLGPHAEYGLGKAILDYVRTMGTGSMRSGGEEVRKARGIVERSILRPMNQRAAMLRDGSMMTGAGEVRVGGLFNSAAANDAVVEKAMMKATLDVGTLTNFSNITGGQSLGYVSLDTRMARGTVRPNSFTLYQSLDKSMAWQIVDFWAQATETGGAPPGAAFANYSSVSSGSLATSAGAYQLSNILLKLALDGRAITTALAAQNNYINVSEQENTNAALVVLKTIDWALYWGNATLYPNQFDGISQQLINAGYSSNIFNYQTFYNTVGVPKGWSAELTLYNLIYEAASQITSYSTYGHITHAFMSPAAMGSLQGLTTTQLNNVLTQISELQDRAPLVVNGNLVGMQTRVGHIQFPLDLFIDARMMPVFGATPTLATVTGPTKPVSVTVTVSGAALAGSQWTAAYAGGNYYYAVAGMNASGLESTLTYSAAVSGVITSGATSLVIAPPGAADATAFRVYRSGLGLSVAGSNNPIYFRYIGDLAANGSSNVTFIDNNSIIPGSTSIFLLDMDPIDLAIDFRTLLPLVRVELFASNLFMPWAVAMIGAVRLRIPKFHGIIANYVPTNPTFSPLQPNG